MSSPPELSATPQPIFPRALDTLRTLNQEHSGLVWERDKTGAMPSYWVENLFRWLIHHCSICEKKERKAYTINVRRLVAYDDEDDGYL